MRTQIIFEKDIVHIFIFGEKNLFFQPSSGLRKFSKKAESKHETKLFLNRK